QTTAAYRRRVSLRIADSVEADRPRERLWAKGAGALSDAELIALVIGSGSAGESALALSSRLLALHGGVRGLAGAAPEELSAIRGVGPAKAASLLGWPVSDLSPQIAEVISPHSACRAVVVVGDG
ncbi:MAG: UPF0758 domain-containing protein, partial [Geminicoccaceae bacterium]